MSRRRAKRKFRMGDPVRARYFAHWGGQDHCYWERGTVVSVWDLKVLVHHHSYDRLYDIWDVVKVDYNTRSFRARDYLPGLWGRW